MRYYIVELLLPFIDEDEMKLFENSEYYFIKNKDKIKYFESNKLDFKCDCHMLKNFHEYLQDYVYVKYDNELHNEEGYEIHFNRNWEIKKKNNKFNITYDGNEIFINSKNNYIDYLKYFSK